MKHIITVKNLDFSYATKTVFKNFALSINTSSITTIIGNNDSGKSTLAKILIGLEKTTAEITINKLPLNENIKKIREFTKIVFSNPDENFINNNVIDEVAFSLETLHYNRRVIKEKIYNISRKLNIEYLLEKEIKFLSSGEKALIAIASALVTEPKILILDEILSLLDTSKKEEIFKYLKQKGTTVINITNDIEDAIFGEQLLLIDHGRIILNDETTKVLDNEKVLNKYGFNVPFMHDLSIKLGYYELLNQKLYNVDEMVNCLWK